jgi:hypothetical protein
MGGYGSTRWLGQQTRLDTDGLLKLDIRVLRRQGALQPGALSNQTWTRWGECVGMVNTFTSHSGGALILSYIIVRDGRAPEDIRETVILEATPCIFGGKRTWFRCPGCSSRRSGLFSVEGRFRCRRCHDLAYTATRQDELDRADRRVRQLQERLGFVEGYHCFIPPRPDGMHRSTYRRLSLQLREAIDHRDRLFADAMQTMVVRYETPPKSGSASSKKF